MADNSIREIKAVPVDGPEGPTFAIMIAVDIADPKTAGQFVSTIAEQFKVHRMLAPPETSMLLVTLIGDLSARVFADCWRDIEERDAVVHFFMGKMVVADVVQGSASGQQLGTASLIARGP